MLYRTHVKLLFIFFLCRSIMYFCCAKVPKRPAHGKSSQAALCCNKLLHRKRSPGFSLFCELLHRKRSPGLSLFEKREYDKVGRELEQRRSWSTAKPGGALMFIVACNIERYTLHIKHYTPTGRTGYKSTVFFIISQMVTSSR